jgi:hypothetical protein
MPVIPAIQEIEIRRIRVQDQTEQNVSEVPISLDVGRTPVISATQEA